MDNQQKKDYARHLYLNEQGITQKEVAERVGVSKNTITRWVREGQWDELRTSLLTGRDVALRRLYAHLKEMTDELDAREPGERYLSNRDVDVITKLTAAIRNLEVEANIADKIEVGKDFLTFARRANADTPTIMAIGQLFDAYIKSCL